MVVRSTFLIVLFAILFSHSVIGQDTTDELITTEATTVITTTTSETTTTTTTRGTSCNYPDEFPLFGDNTCISRTTYTAIFLTSIILAGVSFLMLIGLVILYCCRYSELCGSNDVESSVSDRSDGKSSIGNTPSMNGGRRQYTSVVRNMTGTTPLERPTKQTSSSAPYSPATPIPKVVPRTKATAQPANGNTNLAESYELTTRQTGNAPTNPPRTQPSSAPKTTNLDDRPIKNRGKQPNPNEETETSYF